MIQDNITTSLTIQTFPQNLRIIEKILLPYVYTYRERESLHVRISVSICAQHKILSGSLRVSNLPIQIHIYIYKKPNSSIVGLSLSVYSFLKKHGKTYTRTLAGYCQLKKPQVMVGPCESGTSPVSNQTHLQALYSPMVSTLKTSLTADGCLLTDLRHLYYIDYTAFRPEI